MRHRTKGKSIYTHRIDPCSVAVDDGDLLEYALPQVRLPLAAEALAPAVTTVRQAAHRQIAPHHYIPPTPTTNSAPDTRGKRAVFKKKQNTLKHQFTAIIWCYGGSSLKLHVPGHFVS
jgi:hypothetical protein